MYPVHTLSTFCFLTSSILLALSFGRVKADGETEPITLKCGDIMNLTSPNYPDNYDNNLNIHWEVRADVLPQRIVVIFNDFQTENHDTLRIEEENYPSATAKYSGNKVIAPYLSLGGHLSIIFISDSSQSKTGFHLSFSCLTQTGDNTDIHEAFEGLEHIRVLTQPVCRNARHMDVADTICREAGFPGTYVTTWKNNTSGLNGTSYTCNPFAHRLQDCENFTSNCTDSYKSVVINCNVLSLLGCFNLAKHIHLLSKSVKLSRDQCLTRCKSYPTTPQYAVQHSRTNCSCVNQTALDYTILLQDRDRCRKNTGDSTGHWATLFNVSFGFCSEPPEVDNGSWNNTSNGLMYGTTITAKCDDNYELVGGNRKMRCDKATTSTTRDFEWHGIMPTCQKRNTVSFGFCNQPPQLRNGIWKTTSNGYIHGTSITAMCNDDHELVGGDKVLKCGRGANSSSPDFDWHGNTPSCQERIFGSTEDIALTGYVFPSTFFSPDEPVNGSCKSINYCAIPLSALVPVIILLILALISILVVIVVEFVLWMERRNNSTALGSSAVQSHHRA